MNRRSFLALLGLAPVAAAALPAAPEPIITMGVDLASRSGVASWAIVSNARIEAERARWHAVGILDAEGRFSPEAFAADYPTRVAMRAAESRLGSQGTPADLRSCRQTPPLLQICAQPIPVEPPRGDS